MSIVQERTTPRLRELLVYLVNVVNCWQGRRFEPHRTIDSPRGRRGTPIRLQLDPPDGLTLSCGRPRHSSRPAGCSRTVGGSVQSPTWV